MVVWSKPTSHFTDASELINHSEYGNLQEWAKRTGAGGTSGTAQKKRVIYGSTAILSATEFVNSDLVRLGSEST